jgi:hypothetical protein
MRWKRSSPKPPDPEGVASVQHFCSSSTTTLSQANGHMISHTFRWSGTCRCYDIKYSNYWDYVFSRISHTRWNITRARLQVHFDNLFINDTARKKPSIICPLCSLEFTHSMKHYPPEVTSAFWYFIHKRARVRACVCRYRLLSQNTESI